MTRLPNKFPGPATALFLSLFVMLGFSTPTSAALVEYSGANTVIGSDGVKRYVQVWMVIDDEFVKNPGTPPPVPGGHREDPFGHFKIVSTTVHVSGLGPFVDANGRLNIWYRRSPTVFDYYTEELEVFENHGMMKFLDGAGGPWNWAPWLASPAEYELPPELMIQRLDISPGYSFFMGNEIHLFRVCRCRVGGCSPERG